MAITATIDPRQATAFIQKSGQIAPGELLKSIQNLVSSPKFGDVTKILIDTTKADFQNLEYTEICNYAEYCGTVLKDFRIVIIAPTDVAFGVARMFETLSDIENLLITRNACIATVWIGVHLKGRIDV
jgi:hypothetical protein